VIIQLLNYAFSAALDIGNRMVEWLWIVDSLVRYGNGSWPI